MKLLPILKNSRNKAIVALILANIIWGAASPIFKLALENITPFTLAFLRFAIASLILLPFVFPHISIQRKDAGKFFLLAFVGIFLHISFYFFGLKYAPAINAPIIASAGPVLLFLSSFKFLHEKPNPKILLGIFTSLLGVIFIIGLPILTRGKITELIGNLLIIIATIFNVIHAVISKELCYRYKTITLTFWAFVIAATLYIPLFIIENYNFSTLSNLDWRGWSGIIFGAVLSSITAYYLFEWGLARIEAQEVGIFTYLDPISAAILAWVLLGEIPTTGFLIGCMLVFGGLIIAEGKIHYYHPRHIASKPRPRDKILI